MREPSKPKRVEVTLRGRVQGVGFRAFTRREAERRGLVGYVENTLDGSVHLVVEGRHDLVDNFLEVLQSGPEGAEVNRIDVDAADEPVDAGAFVIRR